MNKKTTPESSTDQLSTEVSGRLHKLVSYCPGIKINKHRGIIGKHPEACLLWYGDRWLLKIWRLNWFGFKGKRGFKVLNS